VRGERPGAGEAGQDERSVWARVARETGGRFERGLRPEEDRVVVDHELGEVVLETRLLMVGTAPVQHTRAVAFFWSDQAPRLVVRRANVLRRVTARFTGGPGRTSGLPGLGTDFIVRTDDLQRARQVAGGGVGPIFVRHPSLDLVMGRARRRGSAADDRPNRSVRVQVLGKPRDPELLSAMLQLALLLLDGMARHGLAVPRRA
jgi:hypothetical protein